MPRSPKPLVDAPPANEQAEIAAMLRWLEELHDAASNSDLRRSYDVVYRLAMLRAPGPGRR